MVERTRDINKSSKAFTSIQQSNKERKYYYGTIHEDNQRMKEDMLNPISFAANNNAEKLYYHQSMKSPDVREFHKDIIKEFNFYIKIKHRKLILR